MINNNNNDAESDEIINTLTKKNKQMFLQHSSI